MPTAEKRPTRRTAASTETKRKTAPPTPVRSGGRIAALPGAQAAAIDDRVRATLDELAKSATPRDRESHSRFGITATNALGVSMANIQEIAKPLGRSHELALALWETRCYEARLLAAFVDEPAKVTPAQMDRWCRDFDNWGVCDTLCFKLFDQTPHAWTMVRKWSTRKPEQEKRAAFALLASLAGHDKKATDEQFLESLELVERAATDDRNFVKKGVSWALRRIATRNAALKKAATEVAMRLAASEHASARWIGKDALREFEKNAARRRAT